MRIGRIVIIGAALVFLFAAGVATSAVDLRKLVLKPGHCVTIKVAKVRVCAPKARPPVTTTVRAAPTTVTSPPTTVTSPPLTVTSPLVTVTTPPVTVTVTTTPTPKVAFSDGTYRVGVDIVAGTYQGVTATSSCYWERLRGFSGTLTDIIANYFGIGPTIVTIAPTDVGFRSDGCGGWTKIG